MNSVHDEAEDELVFWHQLCISPELDATDVHYDLFLALAARYLNWETASENTFVNFATIDAYHEWVNHKEQLGLDLSRAQKFAQLLFPDSPSKWPSVDVQCETQSSKKMDKFSVDLDVIEKARNFTECYFAKNSFDPSHDLEHVERVYRLSMNIANQELLRDPSLHLDMAVVKLAALLHDVGDFKYSTKDKDCRFVIGPFLYVNHVSLDIMERVLDVIDGISFRKELERCQASTQQISITPELAIVQDADRLDAIGAIGIARCFGFGAARNRPMYDPAWIPPYSLDDETTDKSSLVVVTKREYDESVKQNKGATLNHFYEKLLTLKDRMKTETGKEMAERRHDTMVHFLREFHAEAGLAFQ